MFIIYRIELQNLARINVIRLIVLITFISLPSILKADDLGKFANKLFNHYQYDEKINNYLKSFFTFKNKNFTKKNEINSKSSMTSYSNPKQSLKIKSKNKLSYDFGNDQSIQINPSNIDEKIIYNNSSFTFFEIKKDSILYGINLNF